MMKQIKQDLVDARNIAKDLRDAPGITRVERVCHSCQVWGINRVINAIDVARYVKHLVCQKQK